MRDMSLEEQFLKYLYERELIPLYGTRDWDGDISEFEDLYEEFLKELSGNPG